MVTQEYLTNNSYILTLGYILIGGIQSGERYGVCITLRYFWEVQNCDTCDVCLNKSLVAQIFKEAEY